MRARYGGEARKGESIVREGEAIYSPFLRGCGGGGGGRLITSIARRR